MRRVVILTGLLAATVTACGGSTTPPDDDRVLVFTRTLGYRHADSIEAGQAALVTRFAQDGIEVESTEDPLRFRDAELARFGAVIFLYTSGNDVLDAEGKAALEAYV